MTFAQLAEKQRIALSQPRLITYEQARDQAVRVSQRPILSTSKQRD